MNNNSTIINNNKQKPSESIPNIKHESQETSTKPEPKKGWYKRSKEKITEFGIFGLVFYITTYISTGVIIYFMVKNKIIDKEGVLRFSDKINLERFFDMRKAIKKVGDSNVDLALAIAVNEILEVIRLPLVIMFLTRICRKK